MQTELDAAHAAMEAAPDDDNARLRFYERLADGEVFLLSKVAPTQDRVTPDLFVVDGVSYALVFDREARLSAFVGKVAPFVGMSGRALAAMLAGQGIGVALNLDVAPSAMLIPPDAVDWLAATLAQGPAVIAARPVEVFAPRGLPDGLLQALDRKLASASGLAQAVWLVGVRYMDGGRGHLLCFVGALPGAEGALAAAVGEALVFSGIDAGALDVTFLPAADPIVGRLARVGLRFDLPELVVPAAPTVPGMDPDRPPKLR
jgi:hypothetical protein